MRKTTRATSDANLTIVRITRTPWQKKGMSVNESQARPPCEFEHDFVLVLTDIGDLTPGAEDALFEAGCDDATISVRSGRIFLSFTRMAFTLKDAILSAIGDVGKANIGAHVLRVDDCNLVTQSEIARKISRSRQLVHQYITGTRGPGKFPPPVCGVTDENPLWAWCDVAYWLRQNDMITEESLRDAQDTAVINSILDFMRQRQVNPDLFEEVYKLCEEQLSQEPDAAHAE
jgi:hypothetical protein